MFVEDFVETEEAFAYSLIFSTKNLSIVLLECHEKASLLQYFDNGAHTSCIFGFTSS